MQQVAAQLDVASHHRRIALADLLDGAGDQVAQGRQFPVLRGTDRIERVLVHLGNPLVQVAAGIRHARQHAGFSGAHGGVARQHELAALLADFSSQIEIDVASQDGQGRGIGHRRGRPVRRQARRKNLQKGHGRVPLFIARTVRFDRLAA